MSEAKNDRNRVKLGPARSAIEYKLDRIEEDINDTERETAQEITNVTNTFNEQITIITETLGGFGGLGPGYWYTSEYFGPVRDGGLTGNGWSAGNTGVMYPFGVIGPSLIDAFGVHVTDNVGTPNTTPPPGGAYYTCRVGIYTDVDGFPGELMAVSNTFSYGDGSMTDDALNILTLASPVYLPAGRYWLMLRRSGNLNLPNPAYLMGRTVLSHSRVGYTKSNLDTIANTSNFNYGSYSINFPTVVGGDPVLPSTFDPSSYTLTLLNVSCPEIWVRGA
jgi:hypothetical protein